MTTQATNTQTINGIAMEQFVATVNAIKANPELAKFRFRAQSEWIDGARSRTRIQSFHGAGTEDTSRAEPFVMEADEPPVLLGENSAPNAVEAVLHALAACLGVGFIYNAAAQGITVEKLDFTLEGDMDLHAFLGLSDSTRPGYENISVVYRVKADAPRDQLEELCDYVQRTSPVLDIIRNATPVSVALA